MKAGMLFPGQGSRQPSCILIEAKMALKKDESIEAAQLGLGFHNRPSPTLRAVHATVNGAAREAGVQFFRIGECLLPRSLLPYILPADTLKLIKTSIRGARVVGKRLDASPVRVKAKKSGDSVQALVILMRQD
jgi:hypothetical protein